MDLREGLTFDDVLLVPKYSEIASRGLVDTSSSLTKRLTLKVPIVSANMDTVTESKMAIEMARFGAVGVIHRFLSIESQAAEVEKVKRSESFVIERPVTISRGATLGEAVEKMKVHGISSLLVASDLNKLEGILTQKDLMFQELSKKVEDVMTKSTELIVAPENTSIEAAKLILKNNKIEKLPLIEKDFVLKGLITAKDIVKKESFPNASQDLKGRLIVGAAVGVADDCMQRAEALVGAGADFLVLDIAHGHSKHAIEALKNLKSSFNAEVIAGNVATAKGTQDLIDAGADAVKVGIGNGAVCTTRIVTGCGVPQITALHDCVEIAREFNVPIVADGGIRYSGDIVKALAAGASTVMLGSILAGTEESPGRILKKGHNQFKVYRGMASLSAAITRKNINNKQSQQSMNFNNIIAEGVETLVPFKGSAIDILKQMHGGLRSGMSYCNAMAVTELPAKAEFIKITNSGLIESHPHGAKESD